MKIFDKINNEQRKPLLSDEKVQVVENKGMGSKKWHTLLRAVGPHLAGQGGRPGFLSKAESFTVKTLTKETLGEVPLLGWRGLHQDSKQNCYTTTYLIKPWALTLDPCDTAKSQEDHRCHLVWVLVPMLDHSLPTYFNS